MKILLGIIRIITFSYFLLRGREKKRVETGKEGVGDRKNQIFTEKEKTGTLTQKPTETGRVKVHVKGPSMSEIELRDYYFYSFFEILQLCTSYFNYIGILDE